MAPENIHFLMMYSDDFYAYEHLITIVLRNGFSYNVKMIVMPGKVSNRKGSEN